VHTSVLPHRHWPSGRHKTLGNSIYPANQLHAGSSFRRFVRSLLLRPYSLLAPRADRTRAVLGPLRSPGCLLPGFQVAGSPRAPAGYDYGAKLRIAPAGLSPASTATSLAAPCPGASLRQSRASPVNKGKRAALTGDLIRLISVIVNAAALPERRSGQTRPKFGQNTESQASSTLIRPVVHQNCGNFRAPRPTLTLTVLRHSDSLRVLQVVHHNISLLTSRTCGFLICGLSGREILPTATCFVRKSITRLSYPACPE